jgi:YD repeat-containing protein
MNKIAMMLPKSVLLFLPCLILSFHPLTASAESVTYQYDIRHRLIGAVYSNGATISYTYDAAGNRLTVSTGREGAAIGSFDIPIASLNIDTSSKPAQPDKAANTSAGTATGSSAKI